MCVEQCVRSGSMLMWCRRQMRYVAFVLCVLAMKTTWLSLHETKQPEIPHEYLLEAKAGKCWRNQRNTILFPLCAHSSARLWNVWRRYSFIKFKRGNVLAAVIIIFATVYKLCQRVTRLLTEKTNNLKSSAKKWRIFISLNVLTFEFRNESRCYSFTVA